MDPSRGRGLLLWAPSPQRPQRLHQVAADAGAAGERCRRPPHARPDAAGEVPFDPSTDLVGAAITVEALQVETDALGSLPQMRVVHAPAVGIERITHLPERALEAGGLRGC